MSGAKDLLYKGSMIKETSQNLKHLGEMWNIDSLSQEGAKNEKNPGRAIGKARNAERREHGHDADSWLPAARPHVSGAFV
jgi:hypothetical protein